MRWLVGAALFIAVSLGAAGVVVGQEVSELVDRHVAALGGLEAVRNIETLRKTGTYVYNGLEHPVVVVQKRGAGCREEIAGLSQWGTAVEAGKLVVRAWDGESAWVGAQGEDLEIEPMHEGEIPGFLLDAEIESSLVDPQDKGHQLKVVGTTEVEGVAALQVDVVRADGVVEQWFLDSSTWLPVMRKTEAPDSAYKAPMIWYFDDYRDVAGVQMPYYVLIEERLFSREYIFDRIEPNVDVDDEVFAQPAESTAPDS